MFKNLLPRRSPLPLDQVWTRLGMLLLLSLTPQWAQAADCDLRQSRLQQSLPPTGQRLVNAALRDWPQEFAGRAASSELAIQAAQQRVAEAIFLRVESVSTSRMELRISGESEEEFFEETKISDQISSRIDIPLPPPEILSCNDGTTLAIYPLTVGQLAGPSVEYAKEAAQLAAEAAQKKDGDNLLERLFGQNGPKAIDLSRLLRAYRSTLLLEQRSRYRSAALQLAGIDAVPPSSNLRSELDPLLKDIQFTQQPELVRLVPESSNLGFRYLRPLTITLEFRGQPLVDLPLRLRFQAGQGIRDELRTTTTSGNLRLTGTDLPVTLPGDLLNSQAQLDQSCPQSLSVSLDLGPEANDPMELGTVRSECVPLAELEFGKADRTGTVAAWKNFLNRFPDSPEQAQALRSLTRLQLALPEGNLREKEQKRSELQELRQYGLTGSLGEDVEDNILRLSNEIEEETAVVLDDPLAEDAYLLQMRSVANPRYYVLPELRIALDEGKEERFSLRRLALGWSQEEGAFGGMLDLRYDPRWKQPFRQMHLNGQFRAYGTRSTPFGLALGGTYFSYSEDRELLSQGSTEGTDPSGASQFSPTENEWEIYAVGIAKFASSNSFLHLYVGSLQLQGAWQYYLKAPEFALIAEAQWRHQEFQVIHYNTDTATNNDYAERQKQAEDQQQDMRLGLKFGNQLSSKVVVQTRVWYSTQEESLLLGVSAQF